MIRTYVALFLLIFLTSGFLELQGQKVIRYVSPEQEGDKRHIYSMNMLDGAMKITESKYGAYELVAGPKMGSQNQMINLKAGKQIDILISMTSVQLEELFEPIRVPLYKGLIGKRLLLIHKNQLDYFSKLKPEDLKKVTMVQGMAWPDTKILHENGYKTIGGDVYTTLFDYLTPNEPIGFPRAVHEIWGELNLSSNYEVAPSYYFYYPTALYFFVRKDQKELAQRIEEGLLQMIDNGSFDAFFYEFLGENLKKADLNHRVEIKLNNPFLPAATPLDNSKLWYSVKK